MTVQVAALADTASAPVNSATQYQTGSRQAMAHCAAAGTGAAPEPLVALQDLTYGVTIARNGGHLGWVSNLVLIGERRGS